MNRSNMTLKVAALVAAALAALAVTAAGPSRAADETVWTAVVASADAGGIPIPGAAEECKAPSAQAAVLPQLPAEAPAPASPEAALRPAGIEADAEPLPEEAVKAPELVGPDDDRLLEEVQKRVGISPPEPAIELAQPSYDLPFDLNAKVLDYIEVFQTTRRRNFEEGLRRSRKYEALMKPIFREYGIPTDLFYLALIESGYNPKAYSYARAMGIWQFISSTGKVYGLRRTEWLDERCDPEKSTRAAARHLRDLYEEFGSWPLVLAAYNAGKGRVQRAIAKAGSTDFWALELPGQTRNYVPAFFATLVIVKSPEQYGFEAEFDEVPATEVVDVGGGTRLSLVAALCGTSIDAIRELNPELRRTVVPPGATYPLRIPGGTSGAFAAGLAKVPPGKATASSWSSYRVAAGDTLFGIAQRFGTTVDAIREANHLADSRIRSGDQLTIPGRPTATASIPKAPDRVLTASAAAPETYRVRGGDSPWSIARRFNVPLEGLLAWNGLEDGALLRIGQELTLRAPADETASTTAAAPATAWYEVRKGDTLSGIARKTSASIDELRRLNGFAPDHLLKAGDRVVVPGSL